MHPFERDVRDRESRYDSLALTQRVNPTPMPTSFEYNRENQLTKLIRPDAQELLLSYQPATGKLASIAQAGSGTYTLTYKTTPANQATGLLDSVSESFTNGSMSFGYLGDRRSSTTWSGPVAGSVAVTSLRDGLVGSQSVNGGNTVSFGYDKDGLMTSAGAMTLTRNTATGFLQNATLAGFPTTARTRNDFGELASETTGTHYSVSYPNRDKLGRVTQRLETLGGVTTTTDYSYDFRGRLQQVFENSVLVRDYRHDDNSNRISIDGGATTIASYDAQDRLTNYGTTSYSYTQNGELLTKTESAQTTSYGYDLLGNLRSVNLPDGRTLSYGIDGANRRIGKRINGTPVQGFLYGDQLEPVAEIDGSNALVSRFVYGSKPNVPDYMVRDNQTFQILSDELGTVRLVVLASSPNTVRQRIDYDEFRRIASRQGFDSSSALIPPTPAPFQPFGFAGGLYDPDTNLVRFGARDYDPAVGRWTSKDPIRFGGKDPNLFGYSLSDPANSFDRTGKGPNAFLGCLGVEAALLAKDIYGYNILANQMSETVEELERLERELEGCNDPVEELRVLDEIRKLKAETALKKLAQAAEAQAIAVDLGVWVAICPRLISLPTP